MCLYWRRMYIIYIYYHARRRGGTVCDRDTVYRYRVQMYRVRLLMDLLCNYQTRPPCHRKRVSALYSSYFEKSRFESYQVPQGKFDIDTTNAFLTTKTRERRPLTSELSLRHETPIVRSFYV